MERSLDELRLCTLSGDGAPRIVYIHNCLDYTDTKLLEKCNVRLSDLKSIECYLVKVCVYEVFKRVFKVGFETFVDQVLPRAAIHKSLLEDTALGKKLLGKTHYGARVKSELSSIFDCLQKAYPLVEEPRLLWDDNLWRRQEEGWESYCEKMAYRGVRVESFETVGLNEIIYKSNLQSAVDKYVPERCRQRRKGEQRFLIYSDLGLDRNSFFNMI